MRTVWLGWVMLAAAMAAQVPPRARVCLMDFQGRPIAGATLARAAASGDASASVRTAPDGCATLEAAPAGGRGWVTARAQGFATMTVDEPLPGASATVALQPDGVRQTVTVTADRGLAGVDDQATSVAVLDRSQLASPAALGLDDRLHQVAGFQLFRRTSSWTANPTTEGVSLRGLGSTAASRTLVESDQVPLNDAFGGWIHWDEIPALAVNDVQIERGGAADLYGSSAIGGVIAVDPVTPPTVSGVQTEADALGATENTGSGDLLVIAGYKLWSGLMAGSGVRSGGYIPTAPSARGAVDVPATVAEQSGRVELRLSGPPGGSTAFLRGNVLNEDRGNGTPDQTNGTRLWRYLAGADVNAWQGHAALRLFGDRETYRQSFSAIAADRNSETLTRVQRVPADELGFAATGSRAITPGLLVGLGLDLRDIRATDAENAVKNGAVAPPDSISAHQRNLGGYAEGLWAPKRWSISASLRVDSFRTFDGREAPVNGAAAIPEPEIDEVLASPHLGVVRSLPHGFALTGTVFRAFRGPTLNELYRTGQVGQQTTLPNPRLLAERATGFELGGAFASLRARGRELGHLRASYFWTEVNRPISAVLLAQTPTTEMLQRQNLGQIRSRGLSLEAGSARWRGFEASAGYQLAIATVTAFNTGLPVQANLVGNWLPEVPREMVTATANWSSSCVIDLHLVASYTGRAFDDANNLFLLHPYARFDVSANRRLAAGLSLYAAVQNLADRAIDAGRTPVPTLAAPRLVQGGLRYSFRR